MRDLTHVEKGSSTRLFCACFDPSTRIQSLHSATWFSLSPRRPRDVRQGRVDLELHSVSCASSGTFPRRWTLLSRRGGFGKMITIRNFNYPIRSSIFSILEEPLYRHRPALGASASRHFAFACWSGDGAPSRVARSLGLCSLVESCCSTRPRTVSSRGLRKQQMNHILLRYSAFRVSAKALLSRGSRPRL